MATSVARFSAVCGLATSEWCSFGQDGDAGDQRTEDAHSLTWTSESLTEDVSILGNPELECVVSADKDQAHLAARLVDVWPDGRSTLITFGALNLTHRGGHSANQAELLIPGKKYKVQVEMRAISYIVPKGHRIRLAVSPSYFPMIWPSRENASLEITTGCENEEVHTALKLPVCPPEKIHNEEEILRTTDNPRMGPPAAMETLRPPRYKRFSVHGVSEPVNKLIIESDEGRFHLQQSETIMDTYTVSTFSMEENKPLSAEAHIEGHRKIEYPRVDDGIATCAKIQTKMWADFDNFYTDSTLSVFLNDELFYTKTWLEQIPRTFV